MPIQTNLVLRSNLSRPLTWIEGDANWSLLLENDQFLNSRIEEVSTATQAATQAAATADAKAVVADSKAVAAQQSADQANNGLLNKVDKVDGFGLSQNNYTTAEKDKLAGLESSRFKGQFVSLEALTAAIPVGSIGDYANVDPGAGSTVQRALWDSDDNEWVLSGSGGGQMTPAQIREGYLSNPDTNNFSDADKLKLTNIEEEAQKNYPAMDQATAEGGTSTNLLSVSALRIRQAILGWWNNSSFKTKLDTLPVAPVADGKSYVLKDRSWIEGGASGALIKETIYANPGAISHTFAANCATYEVEVWAGGGPGGTGTLGNGANSTFGTIIVEGGKGGSGGFGGDGGTASGGLLNIKGQAGGGVDAAGFGSPGGSAPRGGGGGRLSIGAQGPGTAGAQPGGGGGSGVVTSMTGGGSGYSFDRKAVAGGSTITGTVGGGAVAGTNGYKGGDGMIIVREYASSGPSLDTIATILAQMPKYYETVVDWVAGGSFTITHGLGAVPKNVQFEAVAKVAVGTLAVGESEGIGNSFIRIGTAATDDYQVSYRKLTATTLVVQVSTKGPAILNSAGGAIGTTPSQVALRIKVNA